MHKSKKKAVKKKYLIKLALSAAIELIEVSYCKLIII